eukprot:1975158-Prymnesium_polylepis.1
MYQEVDVALSTSARLGRVCVMNGERLERQLAPGHADERVGLSAIGAEENSLRVASTFQRCSLELWGKVRWPMADVVAKGGV